MSTDTHIPNEITVYRGPFEDIRDWPADKETIAESIIAQACRESDEIGLMRAKMKARGIDFSARYSPHISVEGGVLIVSFQSKDIHST